MKIIPLSNVPSQTINSVLSGQNCTIKVYSKSTGVYVDVSVNNKAIVQGMIALNRVVLVRYKYLGFNGDLAFVDLQGRSDPKPSGFGSRYVLVYLEPSDL